MPTTFFLSDERRINNPLSIISSLPPRCGIIIRDYQNSERKTLIQKTQKIATNTNHMVFIAALKTTNDQNQHWPQAGRLSQAKRRRNQSITASAHTLRDIGRLNRLGVDGILLSPVFFTQSHPEAQPLNIHRFVRLARLAKPLVYALGGVTARQANSLRQVKTTIGLAGISLFMK